jgi:hypothetical protein
MTMTEDHTTSLPVAQGSARPAGFGATVRRVLLGIDPADTSFSRRRFRGEAGPVRDRLERVGQTFVQGYHAALADDRPGPLAEQIDAEVERDFRGFAYEGAGMALALLDTLIPGRHSQRQRLARFLAGPGDAHTYIVHVGAGWVMARLPVSPERYLARLADPLLRWLALDGYGFHEGFFHWPRSVTRQQVPRRLHGYARRGFDQGLGRSLWFVEGADVERLPRTIGAFPASRQPDLWGGLGLACAYAGGRTPAEVEALLAAAGPHAPSFAQGVAFAAKARQRAGNLTPQTELACRVVWGVPAAEAGAVCDEALRDLPADLPGEPAFEIWRRRVQDVYSRRLA